MTDLASPRRRDDDAVGDDRAGIDRLVVGAVDAADGAAAASGVRVREVTDLAELSSVAALFATIWGRAQGPPLTHELLRAMSKAGSYIGGAFRGETLVGAGVGFHEEPALSTLHSHITGVVPGPWRNVGFAIKLHQRAWALQRGIREIAWTFDPLVARNAYFNITKLGAEPVEYLSNFYGNMADAINGTDETDRLLTRWPLSDPGVIAASTGSPRLMSADVQLARGARVLLGVSRDGLPEQGDAQEATVILIAIPSDIAGLRYERPDSARVWRIAVREALLPLLEGGARVVGFDRSGFYILQQPRASN